MLFTQVFAKWLNNFVFYFIKGAYGVVMKCRNKVLNVSDNYGRL